MNDLSLLSAPGPVWGVAYGGKLLFAWREQSAALQSVSAPIPPNTIWTIVATGPAVHDLLQSLGIFDLLVARLGAHLAAQGSDRAMCKRLENMFYSLWEQGLRPTPNAPWQRGPRKPRQPG